MKVRHGIRLTVCVLASMATVQAEARTPKIFTINPGQSIQETLTLSEPGDTIQIMPGEYHQSVTIKTEGLLLIGMELGGRHVVFNGMKDDGQMLEVALKIEADNVRIQGLHIQDYKLSGVIAYNHDNIAIRDLSTSNTGKFGILSGRALNLEVSRCIIRDASDTGLAMDLIRGATLHSLELYQNAIGLGVFDCTNVSLSDSSIHNNTVGIALEDKGDKELAAEHVNIANCRITGNGKGQFVAEKPMHGFCGAGLYIQGYSHVEVSNSFLDLNTTHGIMVVRSNVAAPDNLSNHAYIHHNTYSGNGEEPSAAFMKKYPTVPGADIYWDGTGEGNRFQELGELKTSPETLITKP
jgi:hypothetical protein